MGYTKDVIVFILERMIPNYPLPRGGIKKRCDEVAVMVNEEFTPDELCGKPVEPKNILYVYQKYGIDPDYGARKGQVIYPAKASAERSTPKVLPSNAKRVHCPHCGGSINLEGSQPSAEMPVPAVSPTAIPTTAPTPVPARVPATVPTNIPQIAPEPSTTTTPTWARMPNGYDGTQQFAPIPQPQPQPQFFPGAGTMPLWCDPNAYGPMQNITGQNDQSQGAWNSSAGNNTLDPQLQGQWLLNSGIGGGNQQMFPANVFEGLDMGGLDAGIQPGHKQPGSEAVPNSHQLSVSPVGLGIMPPQPTQPVRSRPNSGTGRAKEARTSSTENVGTSARRVLAPKRPLSQSQPARQAVENLKRDNAALATEESFSTDSGPAAKRSKTGVGVECIPLQRRGGSMIPPGSLSGSTVSNSFDSVPDANLALGDFQFDWSYPGLDNNQQQHAPEAVPETAPVVGPSSGLEGVGNLPDLDDDFYANFLADLDNLPGTT